MQQSVRVCRTIYHLPNNESQHSFLPLTHRFDLTALLVVDPSVVTRGPDSFGELLTACALTDRSAASFPDSSAGFFCALL